MTPFTLRKTVNRHSSGRERTGNVVAVHAPILLSQPDQPIVDEKTFRTGRFCLCPTKTCLRSSRFWMHILCSFSHHGALSDVQKHNNLLSPKIAVASSTVRVAIVLIVIILRKWETTSFAADNPECAFLFNIHDFPDILTGVSNCRKIVAIEHKEL